MTATIYKIYIVNNSTSTQTFWCFLDRPKELVDSKDVYANSSASVAVLPKYHGTVYFDIPVQYVVSAGADNNAVGLNVEIVANSTMDASLQQTFDANYVTAPPNATPTISLAHAASPDNTISLVSNAFDRAQNENEKWYGNMSFGIQTERGFVGMTWEPDPQTTTTLTPKLTFYIATGKYGANKLASWETVSTGTAKITEDSFDHLACTVTYDSKGGWDVKPGEPPTHALASNLSWFLSDQHAELVALAYLHEGKAQSEKVIKLHWDGQTAATAGEQTFLTGQLTVASALGAAFTWFALSGITFSITRPASGVSTFSFSYSGPLAARAVMDILKVGARIVFGGAGTK